MEKSVPRDQRFSSPGQPRDAKRQTLRRNLSHPRTHNRFFYSHVTGHSVMPYWMHIYLRTLKTHHPD